MVEPDELIKEADRLISKFEKQDSESKSNLNFTLGIIYGLIIGWLCSFTATFVYEELLPKLSPQLNEIVKLGAVGALILVIWYVYLQFKHSRGDIDRTRKAIEQLQGSKRMLKRRQKKQHNS